MPEISFTKYQGTGNDFVLIDNREKVLSHNRTELFQNWCDRKFGVGADGVILIENETDYDFRMIYFNANGKEGSLCGNGGRCAVHFANSLGIVSEGSTHFIAVDGPHDALITDGEISLKIQNVETIEAVNKDFFLDTGSPHYVQYVSDLSSFDSHGEGKAIRNNDRFREKGTNVNFVEEVSPLECRVSTFERGVEDLTLSCGTGVTAVAICQLHKHGIKNDEQEVLLASKGGNLKVRLSQTEAGKFENIWLTGPATPTFTGTINFDLA